MNTDHCAEKIDRIYSRMAWGMLLMGLMFVFKLIELVVAADWQAWITAITPWMGLVVSLLIIWTLGPSVFSKLKNKQPMQQEPEGFSAEMINQALAISWGATICGLVLMQSVSKVLFSHELNGAVYFNAAMALLFISASSTFLYLTHSGYDQIQPDEWSE
ncbi:hypothetical protein ACFODZ_11140 [Marinicella sediminis]|uniref:DUF2178 domain-containing protein n=1 Tax=Marinicella sediminis TaxID=1792834 RepID=A0ABV7J9J9_9GAMM|nr:hypothetical protein [Marinicella sediminis]